MSLQPDEFRLLRSATSLEELDRELARLAVLCQVAILEPGVIDRVLHKDDSVCGADNPIAFGKLHDLLMVHFAIRQELADSLGQMKTAGIESYIIERLKKSFPALAANWPPA